MLSMSQPRTHPVQAMLGLAAVYLVATLVLALFSFGRSVSMEYALALSVVTALFAPLAATLAGAHLIGHDDRVLLEAVAPVLLPTALPPLVTGLLFILLPSCDPGASLQVYLLGPPASAALAVALVALLGKLVRRPLPVAVLAYLVVFSSLGLTLWRLYQEPPTFFFNHFFGGYYGMIYDEVGGVDGRLLRFRLLTWLWALGGLFLVRATVPRRGRVSRRAPAWALLTLLAASLLSWSWNDLLHPSHATIERALGKRIQTPHFDIFVDRRSDDAELQLLARDHEFRYQQLKSQLGVVPQERLRSYVYPSAARKAELMGAAGTQLARPWQLEMHINAARFPHPVLAHELVHVLSATMGTGPLKTSSRFGVLIRPGLVEGLAVALEPDIDELSLLDEARALKEMERLPDLGDLLGLTSFGTEAPSRAYVGAGSLMRYLLDTHGVGRVREFYRSGDFEALAGATDEEVERDWRKWLEASPASARALALTRRRFERPSFFERRCVHARRDHYQQIEANLAEGQRGLAVAQLRELHEEDAEDLDAARWLLRVGRESDDPALVGEASDWLAGAGALTPIEESELALTEADLSWRAGDQTQACELFLDQGATVLASSRRRSLWVRQFVCEWHDATDDRVRDAAAGAMAYLNGRGPERAGGRADLLALQQHHAALAESDHPIASTLRGVLSYLISRQLVRSDPARAVRLLDDTLARPQTSAELRCATLEQRGLARFLTGEFERAEQDFEATRALGLEPYRRRAEDYLERIRFERGNQLQIQIEELSEE